MEMDKRQILTEVTIDCPVCSSRNYFRVGQISEVLLCEDCGFQLSENSTTKRLNSAECLFCGNNQFYYESPFSLSLLGRSTVCYVCEAHYKNAKRGNPDVKFDLNSHAAAQQTDYTIHWKERIKRY